MTMLRTNSTRATSSPAKTSRPILTSHPSGTYEFSRKLLLGGRLEPAHMKEKTTHFGESLRKGSCLATSFAKALKGFNVQNVAIQLHMHVHLQHALDVHFYIIL